MNAFSKRLLLSALNQAPILLFLVVFAIFGILQPRFLLPQNLSNILVQSASSAIVATGMTFVLLTAGVDLSVGAIMFVSAAVAGKMILAGWPLGLALGTILVTGGLFGWVNSLAITRLRILAFITTLSTLYMGRGLGLWITQTRAMNLPENILFLGSLRVAGIPLPIVVCAVVLIVAHLTLTHTAFGRQIYATGYDVETARKAGINTRRILSSVYIICGVCAALGGLVSLVQLGAVSPAFGKDREFTAIAAAVLGGTSLFGGRGRVLPGTLLGAVLIQTVESGLVSVGANPYVYPLATSAIIFLAVLLDSTRHHWLQKLKQRKIRMES
jgi:ribose transport system permease protein